MGSSEDNGRAREGVARLEGQLDGIENLIVRQDELRQEQRAEFLLDYRDDQSKLWSDEEGKEGAVVRLLARSQRLETQVKMLWGAVGLIVVALSIVVIGPKATWELMKVVF